MVAALYRRFARDSTSVHLAETRRDRRAGRTLIFMSQSQGARMAGPHQPAEPPSGAPGPAAPARDGVTDLVRWAVFSCVLVPVVLLWYGTSLAGAAGTAVGLAALTGACRLLLCRSERGAALLRDGAGGSRESAGDHRGAAPRAGGRRRAGRGGRGDGHRTGENTPVG
jgi:hypothetical protein